MKEIKESDIEQMFVKNVRKMGGMALKLNSTTMTGLPDRMVLLPKGILFFVELKAPNKKPRSLQKIVHYMLKDLGFTVYVVDSKDQALEVLKKYEFCTSFVSKDSN